MTDAHDALHLNNHHRDTLMSIFQHPVSHNIDWKAVLSLLNVVGNVDELADGKFRVVIGDEEQFLERPRNKDIDTQMVVDLRRMLTSAGYESTVTEATNEGKEV
jgi:hypothetical protein